MVTPSSILVHSAPRNFQTGIGGALDAIPGALDVLVEKAEKIPQLESYVLEPIPKGNDIKGDWPIAVRGHFAFKNVKLKDGTLLFEGKR